MQQRVGIIENAAVRLFTSRRHVGIANMVCKSFTLTLVLRSFSLCTRQVLTSARFPGFLLHISQIYQNCCWSGKDCGVG